MVRSGHTRLAEQSGSNDLVRYAVAAEGVAMAGVKAVGTLADHLIAVQPDPARVRAWRDARRAAGLPDSGRVIGQLPVCWDPDRDAAATRAHRQIRWAGRGRAVMAELPTPAASRVVRPADVAARPPCGPDPVAIVDAARAGFTDIALLQIGGETQERFLDEAAEPLPTALRAAAG